MKALVIKAFTDAENPQNVYMPSSEFEGTPTRIKGLESLGYVRALEQPSETEEETPKKRTSKARKTTK